jgi:hypothetical protein
MAGYRRVLEARSTTTSAARLRSLARDEIRPVRLWTARNHNAPPDALDLLTQDSDRQVQWNALRHTRTPAQALERMAREEAVKSGDRWFIDRQLIAHHPNAPEPLRQSLFQAGVCRDCSKTCHSWRFYTHRHKWHSFYQPAGLFRRTESERADQLQSWGRDDQAFFAAGACHILAWAFMKSHPGKGFSIYALRERGETHPFHVYVSDGLWAFDHCGWTLSTELREAYEAEVLKIQSDLETFCAEHDHRLPEQFAHLPWQRASDYIARYE